MANAQLPSTQIELPIGAMHTLLRDLRGQCPRCSKAALFRTWLKPVDSCNYCHQDWSMQQADDFPAHIGIFITGHLLAPVVIAMIATFGLSAWLTLAIILPVAIGMTLGMLCPVKGAVIALLWWRGVDSFKQERVPERTEDEI